MNRRHFSMALGRFGAMRGGVARPVLGQPRPDAARGGMMATDRFGDPLPPGTLARFGTIRL